MKKTLRKTKHIYSPVLDLYKKMCISADACSAKLFCSRSTVLEHLELVPASDAAQLFFPLRKLFLQKVGTESHKFLKGTTD